MKVVVELELVNPSEADESKIEEDIMESEVEIGWHYEYKVLSVKVS